MSKIAISLKIDVSKIDKARLFKGQKGTYLDATAFVDLDNVDEYGNSGMITQDVTKEERAAGTKGAILGNSKVFWKSDESGQKHAQASVGAGSVNKNTTPHRQASNFDNFEDDLPF
jgi:hypothetical protein